MKKIGILTYHRSHNYGALLQALALKKIIEDLGHQVYFLDYWPDYHRNIYKIFDFSSIRTGSIPHKIKRIISICLRYPRLRKRRNKFIHFIKKYIDPFCKPMTEKFDVIVYGSDQIWRKQPGLGLKFNPVYFGEGISAKTRLISYAASMGSIKMDSPDILFIKNSLSKFSDISVREEDLQSALGNIGIKDVKQTLDPTILLTKEEWRDLLPLKKPDLPPYALFYDLMTDSFDIEAIKRFVIAKGLQLIILPGYLDRYKYSSNYALYADPIEMMSLIANAEIIFTSSFHGLAFSLIFNKDFYTSFSHNSTRARSLLNMVNLSERFIPPLFDPIPEMPILDYSLINQKIHDSRLQSTKFLKEAIQ